MSTSALIALDLLVAVLVTAAWLAAAGVVAAGRRGRLAPVLLAGALALTVARAASALLLAGRGWWFAQEKLVLAVPLLLAAAGYAAARTLPALLRGGAPGAPAMPLFMAAFSAAVGPVVTMVIGYPVGLSGALVALALVGAAGLVTARATNVRIPAAAVALTVLFGLVGGGLAVRPTPGHAHGGDHLASSALRGPATPAPGGAVRRYDLTAQTATLTLPSGRRVDAWTFNGTVPGPPVAARQGDLLEVHLRNRDITPGVTLHWHGYDVPAGEDGVPGVTQDAVTPGGEFVYRFRADQVGTYWYHTHEVSDRGVKLGLYGSFVVYPRAAQSAGLDLALPVHTLAGATLVGDTDQPVERRVAPGTPVRLRLTDTDDTPRRFALAGVAYRLVAVDGNDLNAPGELTSVTLRLPAGGRYDLAFTMPVGPVTLVLNGDTAIVRLNPDGAATPDARSWPELDLLGYGSPAPTPFGPDDRFDRDLSMVLDRGLSLSGGLQHAFTINGRAFPDVPTQVVAEGDLVRMTVVNRGTATHPWHLHGHRVLVLSRDGRGPTGTPLLLDTFDVRPGEVWQVAFRADNPGVWMNHCHNLSHADKGMMAHLAYRGFEP
ncbi:multicopper oxidase family protein [Rhizomonospora bruguierae]|uniref:multicopper oxidase family protein n=1 Tax=Rhizomonospora bruguierae TaxID=1581705 RepID=UPI001BCB1DBC|nr:multicopper oxidase family protein [Micromonospora sp. NBRC 107566]